MRLTAVPETGETGSTGGNDLADLASAAANGTRAGVANLLSRIRPLALRYCRARISSWGATSVSAEDVAQEVCLAVFTALPSYRDQGKPFLAFVYGIAAHKVADAHRAAARNRAEPVSEVPDTTADQSECPEQRAMQGELTARMNTLLRLLPEKQREILILRIMVGLSAEETAEMVDSTPGAVRVAQHRALAKLRSVLTSDEVL